MGRVPFFFSGVSCFPPLLFICLRVFGPKFSSICFDRYHIYLYKLSVWRELLYIREQYNEDKLELVSVLYIISRTSLFINFWKRSVHIILVLQYSVEACIHE